VNQHLASALAVALAIVLAASLPDPSEPTIIVFGAGLGGLLGTAIGRARRAARERVREIAENWAFAGGIVGAVAYLLTVVGDLS
jgi:threonine dehydrogenase-like Zn-dependent dehydrogenase